MAADGHWMLASGIVLHCIAQHCIKALLTTGSVSCARRKELDAPQAALYTCWNSAQDIHVPLAVSKTDPTFFCVPPIPRPHPLSPGLLTMCFAAQDLLGLHAEGGGGAGLVFAGGAQDS